MGLRMKSMPLKTCKGTSRRSINYLLRVNAGAAWLMYLRFEGDAGFSTRNPDYVGPPKAVIEYFLANGQRDEYPAEWNITTQEGLRALAHFFATRKMAPWLQWHEH